MLAQNFSLGDTGQAIGELQEFLKRYGYLSAFDLGTFGGTTVEALQRYQQFNGLSVTGILDNATAEHISLPRCGVPDNLSSSPVLNFVTTGQQWNKTNLTYRFNSFTVDLIQEDIQDAFIQAFNIWSQVTPLTFTLIDTGTPDILIHFVTGAPGEEPFDGAGKDLARATWFYTADNIITSSRINFDDSEQWTVTVPPPNTGTDLVDLATHEIGHCLGLEHSSIQTAIMRPTFQNGTSQRFLDQDDINGIQSIYGPRINRGEFYTTDGGGNISLIANYRNWRKTWQLIVPGNFGGNGATDLLFYDPTA
ncbi:MAG: matrilysin family metalloendoprotease [Acaryochloridaceae cyanobacterium RU_4_10]|nr:matrilysin family metalloendoprotease [Acaryochloridaceae cyanobacterium RU_4_10]